MERAAAAAGEQVRGNIGDRDHLRYLGRDHDLIEAQGRRGDFATWRVYLYDRAAGTAERLEVVTHGGSTAFANPTADEPGGGHGHEGGAGADGAGRCTGGRGSGGGAHRVDLLIVA